jgi:hypothetical protein
VLEREEKRETRAKKISNKFSDLKNNVHFCSPPKGDRKRGNEA